MHFKRCEICGLKGGRDKGQKRFFMAKFPLDPKRCRKWVQITGKEDLAYVPIEKLHQLKHICGNHFRPKDFTKKKTKLKKNAIPSLLIPDKPLSDDIMIEFPLHIESVYNQPTIDHGYCRPNAEIPEYTPLRKTPSKIKPTSCNKEPAPCRMEQKSRKIEPTSSNIDLPPQNASQTIESKTYQDLFPDDHPLDDDELDNVGASLDYTQKGSPESTSFSWQRQETVIDADLQPDPVPELLSERESALKPSALNEDKPPSTPPDKKERRSSYEHSGYRCNICFKEIEGFRYECVQCLDWDLCGACEARGAHPHHYVLRIPAQRPRDEVRATLRTIRRVLADAIVHLEPDTDTVPEIKDEDLEDPIQVDPSDNTADHITSPNPNDKPTEVELLTSLEQECSSNDQSVSDQRVGASNTDTSESSQKQADSDKVTPTLVPVPVRIIQKLPQQSKRVTVVFKGKIVRQKPLQSQPSLKVSSDQGESPTTSTRTAPYVVKARTFEIKQTPSQDQLRVLSLNTMAGGRNIRTIDNKLLKVTSHILEAPMKQAVVALERLNVEAGGPVHKRRRLADNHSPPPP